MEDKLMLGDYDEDEDVQKRHVVVTFVTFVTLKVP